MPAPEPTDAQLLHAWGEGDDAAGNTLVLRHFGVVYRFFASKLDTGVEDLAHQTFVACLDGRERFRGDASFRAYLLGTARHQLYRHFRKRRREHDALALHAMSAEQLTGSPSAALAARDEVRLLQLALRRIPLPLQILVELHYWEGLRMDEIAAVMEIPAGTVKSRLSRARASLREQILAADGSDALRRSTAQDFETWAVALRDALVQERDRG